MVASHGPIRTDAVKSTKFAEGKALGFLERDIVGAAARPSQLPAAVAMIYDANSPLFRSFLSQKGGASDKRKGEEQKPKEHKPKATENKPVMTE